LNLHTYAKLHTHSKRGIVKKHPHDHDPKVNLRTCTMSKTVVLVTGGTGLVGKGIEAVVGRENNTGESWFFAGSKDGDLRDGVACRALFERVKPTHVIHLAAKVGGLYNNMKHNVQFYRENTQINDHVMECSKDFKVQKLVSMMSTCIFPNKITYPIDETMLHKGPPHDSNSGYSYAKRMIDVMSRAYNQQYGCNFTTVIPTNIYGPHDNFNLQEGHVIPGLMHKCMLAKKNGTDFVVWGSGTPLRQFIYSEDLAELIVWVMRSYDSCDPIILSVGEEEECSIADVARNIAKAFDFKGNLVFDTDKADGQFKKTASNAKLKKLNPSYKFTTIEEGLSKTVKWFENNFDTCRK
jgi:GDP-L-fucose synthase